MDNSEIFFLISQTQKWCDYSLTLLHSERPKLYTIFAFLSAIINPFTLRKAKIVNNFGLSECNRVKIVLMGQFKCGEQQVLVHKYAKLFLTDLVTPYLDHWITGNSHQCSS